MSSVADNSLWLRRYDQRPGAESRLICFPHAGGSASFYMPMSRALRTVDVLSVQYPGRQDRRQEACIASVRELADRAYAELAPVLTEPVALYGHSMGAVVAFEVALRMKADGLSPEVLFASGRRAPSRFRDEQVRFASDEEIIDQMKRLSGTDARILDDEELVRLILPALRADYAAVETYQCGDDAVLDCPIDVLTGDDDPVTPVEEAKAWAEHTTGRCELHVYPGGHFFLTDHQPAILDLIRRTLT